MTGSSTEASQLRHAEAELESTNYEPVSRLASGTFGDVFVVRHRDLETEFVLKLLKPEHAAAQDVVERMRTEARILTRLKHENLLRVTDFGWARSGQPYLVSEKLEGETLADRLKRETRLDVDLAVDLAKQMLAGLGVVHEARLVHRDLKPPNLFLVSGVRPTLKLLDFGIAKMLDAGAGFGRAVKTAEGMMLGTPAYLAPEQVMGDPIDARTDLYAAAGVLYRMLAGRQPFVGGSIEELVIAHVRQAPAPLSMWCPAALHLDEVVARGLAKRAADRFQSTTEFLEAIERATNRHGTARVEGASRPEETRLSPTPEGQLANRGTVRLPEHTPPSGQVAHSSRRGTERMISPPRGTQLMDPVRVSNSGPASGSPARPETAARVTVTISVIVSALAIMVIIALIFLLVG